MICMRHWFDDECDGYMHIHHPHSLHGVEPFMMCAACCACSHSCLSFSPTPAHTALSIAASHHHAVLHNVHRPNVWLPLVCAVFSAQLSFHLPNQSASQPAAVCSFDG
ncbi:unnamed protein product [Discosporangium mesarthrocarpum]